MALVGKAAKKTFLHIEMSVRTLFCGFRRGNMRKNFSENCLAGQGAGDVQPLQQMSSDIHQQKLIKERAVQGSES